MVLDWLNFVLGRRSHRWQELQQQHFRLIQSRKLSLCFNQQESYLPLFGTYKILEKILTKAHMEWNLYRNNKACAKLSTKDIPEQPRSWVMQKALVYGTRNIQTSNLSINTPKIGMYFKRNESILFDCWVQSSSLN